ALTLNLNQAMTWNQTTSTLPSGTVSTTGDTISGGLVVNGTLGGAGTAAVATGTLSGTGTVNKAATLVTGGTINLGVNGNLASTLGITGGTWSGVGGVTGTT